MADERGRDGLRRPSRSLHTPPTFLHSSIFEHAITTEKEKRGRVRPVRHAPALPLLLFLLNPAPLLLKSLDLAPDQLAFERGRSVEEDDAVAVVCLVQHAARFEFEPVELELFAL